MAWRVLADGPMLEIVTGKQSLNDGSTREITHIVVGRQGQIITEDLSESLRERYAAQDEYVMSIVEYGEMVPSDDPETDELVFQARRIGDQEDEDIDGDAELADKLNRIKQQRDAAEAKLSAAEDSVTSLTDERDKANARIAELENELEQAEEAATGSLTYDDFSKEALAVEAEKKGIIVTRSEGEGDPLKADYIKAFEEARSAS
jgi:chromosome segregation ATPase